MEAPEAVFVVTYASPYPEDGGQVEIEGVARTEGGAHQIARERVKAINRMSPITDLDNYTITRHELQP